MNRFFHGSRGDSPAKRLLIHIVLICACVVAIYPFLRVVSISLRPGSALFATDLSLIPEGATLNNYRSLIMEKDFTIWLWNSLLVSIATVIVGVLLAAAAAYAFSRWSFPGRRQGLLFLLTTQMLPPGMLLLPIYVMVVRLKLFNTIRDHLELLSWVGSFFHMASEGHTTPYPGTEYDGGRGPLMAFYRS